MKTRIARIVVSLLVLISVILMGGSSLCAASGKIDITVSVPPQAYFVERIGGNHVTAHVMIPAGANPATYEPTPKQLVSLSTSNMYVKVGVPEFVFEKKFLMTFLDRNKGMTVVDSSEGIRLRKGDPHIWTSPAPVRVIAATIAHALIRQDPSHRGDYEKNLAGFQTEIDQLDRWITKKLAGKEGFSFMIYHPAWGYFADAYGLIQIPIEEEGKAGNAAHIRKMIDLARKKGIHDVLYQEGFDARNAGAIAKELGGEVLAVNPLERNWPAGLRDFTGKLVTVLKR